MVEKSKSDQAKRRKRTQRNFPASTFEEPLDFAKQILEIGSGQPVRRLTLFDAIEKAPESGPSRQLVTNANKYGLVKGGAQAEHLEVTPEGTKCVGDGITPREKARARAKLAILDVEPFNGLFERFVGGKLPAKAVMLDAVKEMSVADDAAEEAVDTFIVNLQFVGLLMTLSGADRIVPIDHLLDSLPAKGDDSELSPLAPIAPHQRIIASTHPQFGNTAFYIAPIGEDDSEQRKHSDLFLGSIVEPALESFKLQVVRADSIDQPGVITRQTIEYILSSRLVIADLSFHNPNVFYELAIRHMTRRPVVQLMRSMDKVPFDVNQVRTILVDTTDIYSLVPKIDTYRSEVGNQVRRALDDPDAVDNPISTYFPALNVEGLN